jgi:hypothetical protein
MSENASSTRSQALHKLASTRPPGHTGFRRRLKEGGIMGEAGPRRPKGGYDLVITVIRCIAVVVSEWIRSGGHI